MSTRRAAIVGGNRIPFARSNGPYAHASNQDMLTATLDGLVARFGLQNARVGEVAAGAVLKHSRDFNLTRESVLGSTLSPETPAYDVQQACGTGLETAIMVANKIALGQIDSGIAAGVDTTSDAPIAVNEDLRTVLLNANRAKDLRGRLKALAGLRPRQLVPSIPENSEPRTGLSMGEHQAITAEEWAITREAQDELAALSHHNLAAAYDRGFFTDLVTPFLKLTRDQNLRPETSVEKLAKLAPAFGRKLANPTMTAGNSTPLTDGASAVLLASDEWAAEHNLPVLAHFVDAETAAVDYVHGDRKYDGLLLAPRLRGAAVARAQQAHPAGLRFLRDSRGIRLYRAGHVEGVGGPRVLLGAAQPIGSARIDRPVEAERQRFVACGRSPVRSNGRPDRCHPRQAAARKGIRPWADLDLRGRRPGRRRDPGGVAGCPISTWNSSTRHSVRTSRRGWACHSQRFFGAIRRTLR
jgi:acetyl-CoA C-acetyltransferase